MCSACMSMYAARHKRRIENKIKGKRLNNHQIQIQAHIAGYK